MNNDEYKFFETLKKVFYFIIYLLIHTGKISKLWLKSISINRAGNIIIFTLTRVLIPSQHEFKGHPDNLEQK